MNAALERLNAMPAAEAEAKLLDCCGSVQWAKQMTDRRPYREPRDLFYEADRAWWSLRREDWLEAFSKHPKIGERGAAIPDGGQAQHWSQLEQIAAAVAPSSVLQELAAQNQSYAERFGYIFIVCATGKSSEEMLALLKLRLQNDRVAELRIAAEEQRRITRLRLEKFLQVDSKT